MPPPISFWAGPRKMEIKTSQDIQPRRTHTNFSTCVQGKYVSAYFCIYQAKDEMCKIEICIFFLLNILLLLLLFLRKKKKKEAKFEKNIFFCLDDLKGLFKSPLTSYSYSIHSVIQDTYILSRLL